MEGIPILAQFGLAGLGLFVFAATIARLALYIKDCFKAALADGKSREMQCQRELTEIRNKVDTLTATTIQRQHDTQVETNRLVAASVVALDRNSEALERLGSGRFPALPPPVDG